MFAAASFVGCGGAAFQSDGDDEAGGEGGAGKGGGGSSSGSAGKASGGTSGGGTAGATGGTRNTGGTGNAGGMGNTGGTGNAGGTGNTGGSEGGSVAAGGSSGRGGAGGSGALGGTGNSGGSGGMSGSAGSAGTGATSTEQWASDFDQSCEFDSNCSLVQQGDKCGCPNCDNGAVNRGDVEHYQSDWEAIQCLMPVPDCAAISCQEQLASCTKEGECYARTPTYIDAGNYPKSCELPSDCHVIVTGEFCDSCRCATAAVNSEGYNEYSIQTGGIDCNPGPSPCDCAPQMDTTCLIDLTSGTGECVVVGIAAASE